ncbi:DUF2490 domain-containing protein [Oceanihabitans sp. 2_MG-2023]|uniref:DUF2490 domain-containing protein n=1 Tax=Oceanihabitans sp. 2_MG-2023 TaxID=3062661 RepID=UPI0026E477B1|nr:DUF2490 domain-containing protein [Oceanihabitans sp. 2_MG-2023]MDO6597232.1 DUF2490 domain-containing protein [Oceanihabitans sp. 2_MG-2023]
MIVKASQIALLIVLCIPAQLFAQKTSDDYLGSWYTLGINHRFTEKFSVNTYGELRFYEPISNYNLTFSSFSGNYHIKKKQTLSVAYAYLDIDSVFDEDNRNNTKENRIYEQYNYKHKLGIFNVQHRFRLEQRFLQLAAKNEMQNRFRYRFSLKYNINKTLFLGIKEEPFVNFQDQAFHENRFFIGAGFHLFKNMQLQMDYLKHHIRKKNFNRIQIGISILTDYRKSKSAVKL